MVQGWVVGRGRKNGGRQVGVCVRSGKEMVLEAAGLRILFHFLVSIHQPRSTQTCTKQNCWCWSQRGNQGPSGEGSKEETSQWDAAYATLVAASASGELCWLSILQLESLVWHKWSLIPCPFEHALLYLRKHFYFSFLLIPEFGLDMSFSPFFIFSELTVVQHYICADI